MHAPRRGAEINLRHDDDIATFQHEVLIQIFAAAHLAEVKRQDALSLLRATNDDDAVELRKRRTATGKAQRLQHVDARIERKSTGLVHLADHIGDVTPRLDNTDGDHGLGNVLLKVILDVLADLRDRPSGSQDLAGERK